MWGAVRSEKGLRWDFGLADRRRFDGRRWFALGVWFSQPAGFCLEARTHTLSVRVWPVISGHTRARRGPDCHVRQLLNFIINILYRKLYARRHEGRQAEHER